VTDHDRHFRTDHLMADLRGRSVRGGASTLLGQVLRLVLTIGFTAILARLLTPEDFGLVALVTSITVMVVQFKELGLADSTVQRREINHAQVSTLFWINVGASVVLMLVTAAMGPLLVWFYGDPRVLAITLAIAPAAVFGGAAVQHQALLRRQMRFGVLATIGVVAPTIAFVAAIVAARAGLGYWAQVIFVVTVPAVSAVGIWIGCPWRPGRPAGSAGIGSMLAFGGHRTGVKSVSLFIVHFDKILVGRLAGAAALGIYAKSYYLFHIPLAQLHHAITSVAATALARLRDDPPRYRLFFTRGVKFLAVVNLPAVVFGMLAADRIVLAVLGDQWTEAIPIFRVLGPTVLMTMFAVATDWAYVSLGHTRRQLIWTLVHGALVIVAMSIGIRHGALGLAIAFSVALTILNPLGVIVCFHGTFLRIRDVIGPIVLPATAAVMAGAATWIADTNLIPDTADGNALAALVVNMGVFGAVYAIALFLLPGGRRLLRETRELSRDLRKRDEPPALEEIEV